MIKTNLAWSLSLMEAGDHSQSKGKGEKKKRRKENPMRKKEDLLPLLKLWIHEKWGMIF